MRRFLVALTGLWTLACDSPPTPTPEDLVVGELRQLVPSERFSYLELKEIPIEERARLVLRVPKEARLFQGVARLPIPESLWVVVGEETSGAIFLLADTDLDGSLSDQDPMTPLPLDDHYARQGFPGSLRIELPAAVGPFESFPLLIRAEPPQQPAKGHAILYSQAVALEAAAMLDGRTTAIRIEGLDPRSGIVDLANAFVGIDCDGDGRIDPTPLSPEWVREGGDRAVFRVGEEFVSLQKVDLGERRITLQKRRADEHRAIDLEIGAELPDFDFLDFEGRPRRLSEFRGGYLLLDFWGTWCQPCLTAFPAMKEAHQAYRAKGFQILGMNVDPQDALENPAGLSEGLAKARRVIAERGIPWPQATTASILELVRDRFRIKAYPSLILLDPQGRIVSIDREGQPSLSPYGLWETLENLLGGGT